MAVADPVNDGADSDTAVPERLPVPLEADVLAAAAVVQEAFGEQIASARADARKIPALIALLLDTAQKTTATDRRYALLQAAEGLAVDGGSFDELLRLVTLRCSQFAVDPSQALIAAVERFIQARGNEAVQLESVAKAMIDRADQALNALDSEQAENLLTAATTANMAFAKACRKQKLPLSEYQSMLASITAMRKRLTEQKRLHADLEAALKTIAGNPDDAAAHSVIGSYRCFIKGDWATGLQSLAKGNSADLRDAARAELSLLESDDPAPTVALRVANAWWVAAESTGRPEMDATAIKAHAAAMYQDLTGMLTDPLDAQLAKSRAGKPTPQLPRGTDMPGPFRTRASPAEMALAQGGGADTEAAVDRALKWIANHQLPDGSWSFELEKCPGCAGKCSHSGTGRQAERGGATGMALLCFLGRGYTHTQGPYKKQVEAGVAFLAQLALKNNGKAYETGGNLYSQGIVGIALSECYGMTQDKRLAPPTQSVLNYIMQAQDPNGGGWRYNPRQPGDTSASGWHIVALQAGRSAGLNVDPLTAKKSLAFLESVKGDSLGSGYGYASPGTKLSTSAIGLLCRTYLGWKENNPGLQKGAMTIATAGPTDDLYYDYYATRLMHRIGGDRWIAWNNKMKPMLLNSQSKKDHEAGSWFEGFDKGHGPETGGRLYITSLATLILEEYYR